MFHLWNLKNKRLSKTHEYTIRLVAQMCADMFESSNVIFLANTCFPCWDPVLSFLVKTGFPTSYTHSSGYSFYRALFFLLRGCYACHFTEHVLPLLLSHTWMWLGILYKHFCLSFYRDSIPCHSMFRGQLSK